MGGGADTPLQGGTHRICPLCLPLDMPQVLRQTKSGAMDHLRAFQWRLHCPGRAGGQAGGEEQMGKSNSRAFMDMPVKPCQPVMDKYPLHLCLEHFNLNSQIVFFFNDF